MSSTSPRKPPRVTLPERLELEYMLDQRRLMKQLEWFTVASLAKFREDQRQDSPALRAFLQLSTPEILDEQKLRRRLRQLASTLTDQKVRELQKLLGRSVSLPSPGLINGWIDDQVAAIQFSVAQWLETATRNLAEGAATGSTVAEMTAGLKVLSKALGRQAEERASFRILQLNSQIIQEVAQGAGSSHYRWITEQDNRVRENHEFKAPDSPEKRHGEVYSWDTPPMGGGTKWRDAGHPGSGYGCRCIAEPLPGGAPLQAFR